MSGSQVASAPVTPCGPSVHRYDSIAHPPTTRSHAHMRACTHTHKKTQGRADVEDKADGKKSREGQVHPGTTLTPQHLVLWSALCLHCKLLAEYMACCLGTWCSCSGPQGSEHGFHTRGAVPHPPFACWPRNSLTHGLLALACRSCCTVGYSRLVSCLLTSGLLSHVPEAP